MEFKIIDYESLDFLLLGSGSPNGPMGPTGNEGSTGIRGVTGPTGATSFPSVQYNSVTNAIPNQYLAYAGQTGSETTTMALIGQSGQFTNMYIYHTATPSNPWTYRLRINNVNTALFVTSSTAGFASASANVAFEPEDLYSVQMTSVGGGVPVRVTVEYDTSS